MKLFVQVVESTKLGCSYHCESTWALFLEIQFFKRNFVTSCAVDFLDLKLSVTSGMIDGTDCLDVLRRDVAGGYL